LCLERAQVAAMLHGCEKQRADAEADQHQGKVARTENAMRDGGLALAQVLERLVDREAKRDERRGRHRSGHIHPMGTALST
jgi:hypothetical protein